MKRSYVLLAVLGCGGAPSPATVDNRAAAASEAPPRLLVPAGADGDAYDALRDDIAAEVALGSRSHRVEIHLRTTADYGCRCPPFVFAPFHNGPDPFVMLIAPPSELPPADLVGGTIRVTGRFDGRTLDGATWAKTIGYAMPKGPDVREGWEHRGPAFVVDGWCWEEPPPGSDDAIHYAERFAALRRAQKTCAPRTEQLVRVEIAGRTFWTAGEAPSTEEHPCCGTVPVDPAWLDDGAAVCPATCGAGLSAGEPGCECPDGTHALRPGLATDAVCGAPSRCVRSPALRVIGGRATDATGRALDPDEWRPVVPGPGKIVELAIGARTERLLLAPGRYYTVHISGGALVAVSLATPSVTTVGLLPAHYRVTPLANGGLRVTATASGVEVLVDGALQGTAPIDLPALHPRRRIELRKSGY